MLQQEEEFVSYPLGLADRIYPAAHPIDIRKVVREHQAAMAPLLAIEDSGSLPDFRVYNDESWERYAVEEYYLNFHRLAWHVMRYGDFLPDGSREDVVRSSMKQIALNAYQRMRNAVDRARELGVDHPIEKHVHVVMYQNLGSLLDEEGDLRGALENYHRFGIRFGTLMG